MEMNVPQLYMAPMAEITTPALRKTIRGFSGTAVLASEMLSASALVRGGMHNEAMAAKHPFDDPFVYQIAGGDPGTMAEACRRLSGAAPYSIDINMGCAAPDILKRGIGAMLLTDMTRAGAIVRACRDAAATRLSVKMRCGFERYDEGYLLDFVRMLADCGVDYITLHPRTAKMGFRRTADWRIIGAVKEATGITLIGNGDITSAEAAAERLRTYCCDGVMIGREAVRSPWIFRLCEICAAGEHKVLAINLQRVFDEVLDSIGEMLPPHLHKSRCHRFCRYFVTHVTYWHELFTRIRKESTVGAIKGIVDDYFGRNGHERIREFSV
ncbi:MAG: tRNA-dihydrouridine synthase family protein [Spirochaetes bacterium]|nr:tRNA-dihydrouridine synthase family protein [Spirochaetota bacterium]